MHLRCTTATGTAESPAPRPAITASPRCGVIIPPTSTWTTATMTALSANEFVDWEACTGLTAFPAGTHAGRLMWPPRCSSSQPCTPARATPAPQPPQRRSEDADGHNANPSGIHQRRRWLSLVTVHKQSGDFSQAWSGLSNEIAKSKTDSYLEKIKDQRMRWSFILVCCDAVDSMAQPPSFRASSYR